MPIEEDKAEEKHKVGDAQGKRASCDERINIHAAPILCLLLVLLATGISGPDFATRIFETIAATAFLIGVQNRDFLLIIQQVNLALLVSNDIALFDFLII